jgi:DNA end-binding protein Ku
MEMAAEELQMARTLVKASTADFNLEKYPDLYTRKLEQLIEAKVAGQELVTPPATPGPQVINLMEALRQSVARVQGAPTEPTRNRASPAAAWSARSPRKPVAIRQAGESAPEFKIEPKEGKKPLLSKCLKSRDFREGVVNQIGLVRILSG